MRKSLFIAFAIVAVLIVIAAGLWRSRRHDLKWLVCYAANLTLSDVEGADWAIVDAGIDPKSLANGHTKFIAYLSVGEAESYRNYWKRIKNSGAVIEANPQWEGNYLVDVRSDSWRHILLNEALPEIEAKGFDGVFLDTLDTAPYLEDRDPKKFAGSRAAVVALVREIRKLHPDWLIVPNNALELLADYGAAVDAAFAEDLYTRYDFDLKKSVATPLEVTNQKEALLDAFKAGTGKPVLNILYAGGPGEKLARDAIARSREKGYGWYLSGVDLMKVGVMNP